MREKLLYELMILGCAVRSDENEPLDADYFLLNDANELFVVLL